MRRHNRHNDPARRRYGPRRPRWRTVRDATAIALVVLVLAGLTAAAVHVVLAAVPPDAGWQR